MEKIQLRHFWLRRFLEWLLQLSLKLNCLVILKLSCLCAEERGRLCATGMCVHLSVYSGRSTTKHLHGHTHSFLKNLFVTWGYIMIPSQPVRHHMKLIPRSQSSSPSFLSCHYPYPLTTLLFINPSHLNYLIKKKATMCFPGPTKRKTSTGINRGCKREESIVRTPYWVKIQLLIQSYSDCPSLKAPWSFWPAGSATSEKLYSLVENLLIWRVVIIPRNIYSLHQRLQIKCHCVWNLASRPYWQGVVDIQKDAVECKRISVCETVNVYMHV